MFYNILYFTFFSKKNKLAFKRMYILRSFKIGCLEAESQSNRLARKQMGENFHSNSLCIYSGVIKGARWLQREAERGHWTRRSLAVIKRGYGSENLEHFKLKDETVSWFHPLTTAASSSGFSGVEAEFAPKIEPSTVVFSTLKTWTDCALDSSNNPRVFLLLCRVF